MRVTLAGKTKNIRFSIRLAEQPQNPSDWIIRVGVFANSELISSKKLNTFYSSALDCSFLGFTGSQDSERIRLKEIESEQFFDAVELTLVKLPWVKSSQEASEVTIVEAQYTAKSVYLASNLQPVHISGTKS